MSGTILGLLVAFFKAGKMLSNKKASLDVGEIDASIYQRIFTFLIILPLIFFYKITITYNISFLIALISSAILIILVGYMYSYSLRVSDVSLVTPIFAITPIMTILPEFLLLNNWPDLSALIGIFLVTIGGYFLTYEHDKNLLEPFRKLFTTKGVQIAFIGSIIGGIVAPIDKFGVEASSPISWVVLLHLSMVVILIPIICYRNKNNIETNALTLPGMKILFILGFFNFLIWITQAYAYDIMNASYVTSFKRVSIILSVIGGYVFFNEKLALQRIPGALLITIGIVLISLNVM